MKPPGLLHLVLHSKRTEETKKGRAIWRERKIHAKFFSTETKPVLGIFTHYHLIFWIFTKVDSIKK